MLAAEGELVVCGIYVTIPVQGIVGVAMAVGIA